MLSKMSLPTDNIYKFYAIFGLLLLITSLFLFTQLVSNYNNKAFDRYIDLEILKAVNKPNAEQKAKKEILEAKKDIDTSDKNFYLTCLGLFVGLSLFSMLYGFYQWHNKIQPMQDKAEKLNIYKLKLEVKILKKQL